MALSRRYIVFWYPKYATLAPIVRNASIPASASFWPKVFEAVLPVPLFAAVDVEELIVVDPTSTGCPSVIIVCA
jgi:hypothetical protein